VRPSRPPVGLEIEVGEAPQRALPLELEPGQSAGHVDHRARKPGPQLGTPLVRTEHERAPRRDSNDLGVDVDRVDVSANLDLAELR